MSTIGHNHAPLEERIFDDPSVTVEDVLAAVASRIERQNKPMLEELTKTAASLSANEQRLPETFNNQDVVKALNLMAHAETHGESVAATTEAMTAAAQKFLSDLKQLCTPLSLGLSGLDKTLRSKLIDAMDLQVNDHNEGRTDGEDKMNCLTLRSSSGAKATLTYPEEVVVENASEVPREYLMPDAKAIAAALKAGKNVPGVGKKRKTSLRISCK